MEKGGSQDTDIHLGITGLVKEELVGFPDPGHFVILACKQMFTNNDAMKTEA